MKNVKNFCGKLYNITDRNGRNSKLVEKHMSMNWNIKFCWMEIFNSLMISVLPILIYR